MNHGDLDWVARAEGVLGFGLALLGVAIWSRLAPTRRGAAPRRRLPLLVLAWLSTLGSVAVWIHTAGGEGGVVYWLISIALAGPLVILGGAMLKWKTRPGSGA